MTLEEFYKELQDKPFGEDYIVTLKYKYDFEEEYTIENELLIPQSELIFCYAWLYDWNEGQTDVEVLGYIPVSEVKTNENENEMYTREEVIGILRKLKSEIDNMPKYFPYTDHTKWFIDGDVFGAIQKHIDTLEGKIKITSVERRKHEQTK